MSSHEPHDAGRPHDDAERVYQFVESLDTAPGTAGGDGSGEAQKWVLFVLADERYAFPVSTVQEIVRAPSITRVPDAPPTVIGITNVRGRVLAVVDLRLRVGVSTRCAVDDCRLLVVVARGRQVGLLVDSVVRVFDVSPQDIKPLPADFSTPHTDFLRGVTPFEDRLVVMLDLDRVLLLRKEGPAQRHSSASDHGEK